MKRKTILTLYLVLSVVLFVSVVSPEGKGQTIAPAQSVEDLIAERDTVRSALEIIKYLVEGKSFITRGARPDVPPPDPLTLAVPFDFNSADLTPSAKRQIDELGHALESPELWDVYIELAGHTDERGSEEYNLDLSRRRVESARDYLLKNFRIEAARIIEVGYGESKPIIWGAKTEAEHAVNRRVQISPRMMGEQEISQPEPDQRPGSESEALRLQYGVLQVMENDGHELIRYDSTSILKSNDTFRIYIHPESECYVYVYQVDSEGTGSWLFPRGDIAKSNPLAARDYWLPSRNSVFTLDETVGTETIYLVASRTPARDLEAYLESSEEIVSQMVTESIATRGLGTIDVRPAPDGGEEKSIEILVPEPEVEHVREEGFSPQPVKPIFGLEIAQIMSRSGDFYVTLRFYHQ